MRPATKDQGERLLPGAADKLAKDTPSKVWASIPRNDNDLALGFLDIDYAALANAVNHAAWWLREALGKNRFPFETFAYQGTRDLRIPILALAAAKVDRQVLFASPYSRTEAQEHLLKIANASALLHSSDFKPTVDLEKLGISEIIIPELSDWLTARVAIPFPYEKTWKGAKDDPWMIFTTTGTTGNPKPVSYTHQMMTSLDAADLVPDAGDETVLDHFANERWYSPLPAFHLAGMTTALQCTVFLGAVYVMGPVTTKLAGGQAVLDILRNGKVTAAMLAPSTIEDICSTDEGFSQLTELKYLRFVGAPLRKAVGDRLQPHVKLNAAIGTTETGGFLPKVRNDADWDWLTFRPSSGVVFERWDETLKLHEMVFHRRAGYERWQQIFQIFPQLDRYSTKDLYAQHPSGRDMWQYVGRTDDFFKLSGSQGVSAAKLEAEILKDDRISDALVGGQGRPRPFVILKVKESSGLDSEEAQVLDDLWPAVEEANKQGSEYGQLSRKLAILADPKRPFAPSAKGSLLRRETLEMYKQDIDKLYKSWNAG